MQKKTIAMTMLQVSMLLLIAGCTSTFSVAPQDFITQLANNTNKVHGIVFIPSAPLFFASRYDANEMNKVLCKDQDGNMVYLFPDKNSQLQITSRSTGDVVKMYFDTAFLEGDKLIGLRSRILPGMRREVLLSDIDKIQIYAEFPMIEKANSITSATPVKSTR